MLASSIAIWQICCTTSCRIVVSLSVGGVEQHVRSRCPCSGVWHLLSAVAKYSADVKPRWSQWHSEEIAKLKFFNQKYLLVYHSETKLLSDM